jgi:hypothetical protein
MEQDRTVTQRRFGVTVSYKFNAENIDCTFKDYSGERRFSVRYEAINVLEHSTMTVNNQAFFRKTLLFPTAMIFVSWAVSIASPTLSHGLGFLSVIIMVGLLIAKHLSLFAIKYTMLQMSPAPIGSGNHPIRVIFGELHDSIISEITSRWRLRMRLLHGNINLANDSERELAKFNWLKERSIITDDEYRAAEKSIRAATMAIYPEEAGYAVN